MGQIFCLKVYELTTLISNLVLSSNMLKSTHLKWLEFSPFGFWKELAALPWYFTFPWVDWRILKFSLTKLGHGLRMKWEYPVVVKLLWPWSERCTDIELYFVWTIQIFQVMKILIFKMATILINSILPRYI